MLPVEEIRRARERISGVAIRTPLLPAKFGPDSVWFKCENLQRGGTFKIRGAYNSIMRLDPAARSRGVTAYSSGNHAQAVALAAKLTGIPACIVMLDQSVKEKLEQTKAYGAEVILGGGSSEEIKNRAETIARERGYAMIHPFDHPDTIAGQGTVGLEILEDLPDVQTVVVAIGGGGLIAGVATAIKETIPRVRVIGVEPEGAAKMYESRKAGRLVTLSGTNTIADGLKPVRGGDLTFEHVQRYVDDLVLVSDQEMLDAMGQLIRKEKLVVEPSGAATFAAVRTGKARVTGKTVCVLSGGNLMFDLLKSL